MQDKLEKELCEIVARVSSRIDLWIEFLNSRSVKSFAEIGVWRGEFAQRVLTGCPSITRYYMVDPWQHLNNWKKPANVSRDEFDGIYAEALDRTEFAESRRVVLRGRTSDVVAEIPDNSLDAVYVDGDHTLRGITIDLISIYSKVRTGGCILGDDFSPSIWQHKENFEPTLVYPFATYFAEAHNQAIYGLPFSQFVIEKGDTTSSFRFLDLTGQYSSRGLREQLLRGPNANNPRGLVARLRAKLSSSD